MAASLRAWSSVVRVKTRHCERAESALAQARAVLASAQEMAQTADAQRAAAASTLDDTRAAWASAIHDNPVFLPEDWLRHDIRLREQADRLAQATQQCARAQARVVCAQTGVSTAQQDVHRAQASRDACVEARDALLRDAALAAEMALDDESGEVAAARIYRQRRRAQRSSRA
ncbi:hypothetical protein [Pandoraea sp. NPDC087047]|uniref:hypothetical protein n=1 Tax=Pandoraea sp. NPDC087047 TaxID=3364390 RepID=UPI00382F4C79